MRAVTFQAPNEVRVEEKPDPEIAAADEALIRVEASGICGSDLHIYHGRVPVEQGFTIGHEYVGTVLDAGADVDRVAVGDRVLGCFHTACATCAACLRGDYHRCEQQRTFGHGSHLGDLQGAQAELLRRPPRQPDPAQGPGGHVRRGGALRRRRDGHRLPRRRPRRDEGRATRSRSSASARSGSARCRRRSPAVR